jgi:hypothetical protein
MCSFRLGIAPNQKDIDGEVASKFNEEQFVLTYGPSTMLDQLPSAEDLTFKLRYDDDEAFKIIERVLNSYSPKSIAISWLDPNSINFEKLWISLENIKRFADSLITNKTLNTFIYTDGRMSYFENKQSMEILAKGISESNLKFSAFINTPEYVMNTLFDTLSTNRTLQQFYLKNSTGLGSRIDNFILGSNVTKLHLVQVVLNDDGITSLKNILSTSTKLEALELQDFSSISFFKKFSDICTGLAENRSLKSLIIGSKEISQEDTIKQLLLALKSHPTIEILNIAGIDSRGLELIAEYLLLGEDSTLKALTINKPNKDRIFHHRSYLDLNLTSILYFSEIIAANTTLEHLILGNIWQNSLYAAFGKALKANKTLLTLDIPVTVESALISEKDLIEYLRSNTTLQKLSLRRIFVADLPTFFDAIFQHPSLTSLDISHIQYNTTQSHSIFNQLMHHLIVNTKTLRELKCSPLEIEYSMPMLLSSLKYNQSLRSVELYEPYNRPLLDFNCVADAFSVNTFLVDFKTNLRERVLCESYLKRNRSYYLDSIILMFNITTAEHSLFPIEIWLAILQQGNLFPIAIDIVFYGKNKLS